jgi:hypothetical protein
MMQDWTYLLSACRRGALIKASNLSFMVLRQFDGTPMKKPVLSIDEPEQKKAPRADRPPTKGFVVVVDGATSGGGQLGVYCHESKEWKQTQACGTNDAGARIGGCFVRGLATLNERRAMETSG